jgi:hypothetical protein
MVKKQFSLRETEEARINNQRILSGTSASDVIPTVQTGTELSATAKTASFFIYGVIGTTVTVTIDGTAIGVFPSSQFLNNPLRVDGTTLAISAGATAYLYYFVIEHGYS